MLLHKCKPDPNVVLVLNHIIQTSTYQQHLYTEYTKEEFLSIPCPEEDVDRDHSSPKWTLEGFKHKYLLAAKGLLGAKMITNYILYPPNSVMHWHTNSDMEGTRVYYTHNDGDGIFKYIDSDGNHQLDYDEKGWTCRTFQITKEDPLWHTIWTNSNRYAFGFMT
jgi:hypothetical protein